MGSAGTHEHDAVTSYVTKVSRAENTVLSDERYRRAAAAGGVGVWDCNLETLEIYVDPALKQMLGYQDHEIQNRLEDCRRLVHPDDEATVFERAQAHIAGHTPLYEAEHRMLHRDGSIRWFIARGRATRDGEGRAISLAGTETDITERKRGEEALRQAEEINKRIVESTTDSLKILDLDGRLIHVNREGLRLLEIDDAAAVLHRPLVQFFEGVVRQAAEGAIAAPRGRQRSVSRTLKGSIREFAMVGCLGHADYRPQRCGGPDARSVTRRHRAAPGRGISGRSATDARNDRERKCAA